MTQTNTLSEDLNHAEADRRAEALSSLRELDTWIGGFARTAELSSLVQLLRIGLSDKELAELKLVLEERGIELGEFQFLQADFSYGNHNFSSSAFLVGVGTDCEELGDYLWEGQDWGNVEPPGPNEGFGEISNDELEAHMDGVGASFSFQEIRDFGVDRFFKSLTVDGFFVRDRVLFCTIEVESSYLAARVHGEPEGTLTITELEEG